MARSVDPMKPAGKTAALVAGIILLALLAYLFVGDKTSETTDAVTPKVTPQTTPIDKPVFTLTDLMGDKHRLADYEGNAAIIHFMAVGCGGEYRTINDNQLKELKKVCLSLCSNSSVKMFTVLISTCTTTDLQQLYGMYNITWIIGNDYQDNKLDIVNTYSKYEVVDGSIVMLGRDLSFHEAIHEVIAADTIISKTRDILESG